MMVVRAKQAVAAACVALALIAGCRPQQGFDAVSLSAGSRLAPDGSIEDARTTYRFARSRMRPAATLRDLCDRIYFQGDMLCFSASFTRPVARGSARVWFLLPPRPERHGAERVDYDGARIYGFSLVGSLLREYAGSGLDRPLPGGRLRYELPFAVIVAVHDHGIAVERRIDGSIVVEVAD